MGSSLGGEHREGKVGYVDVYIDGNMHFLCQAWGMAIFQWMGKATGGASAERGLPV
jgi:hypothetical protein